MLRGITLGLIILGVCIGCSDRSPDNQVPTHTTMATATPTTPIVGSEDWLVWVEKRVGTGDGAGHGPDYGSQEWCFVIEKKLFANASGVAPCTAEWNQKVTDTLLKKVQ